MPAKKVLFSGWIGQKTLPTPAYIFIFGKRQWYKRIIPHVTPWLPKYPTAVAVMSGVNNHGFLSSCPRMSEWIWFISTKKEKATKNSIPISNSLFPLSETVLEAEWPEMLRRTHTTAKELKKRVAGLTVHRTQDRLVSLDCSVIGHHSIHPPTHVMLVFGVK